ncbi:hypothetical protein J22TS1_01770 [Siminovitchia terrae]|nr:hypothetical protein J22TS1_01770 [Siminovitchia terrae]
MREVYMDDSGNRIIPEGAPLEYGRPSCVIKIDDDGVGGGVTDRLREIVYEEGLYMMSSTATTVERH